MYQAWPFLGQFLLIFCAIALGWWLGRRSGRDDPADGEEGAYQQYYRGLNYLLNEQADAATDAFVESLEVNSDTLETHLAVGNLMRRKGEVERAIRIHQNLLARPSLAPTQLHQAHLELARDYISAGLRDRAERLLLDLVVQAPEWRRTSLNHLLEIYQDEREWEKAIDTAAKLLPRRVLRKGGGAAEQAVSQALAHYWCELVGPALQRGDYHAARGFLKQALAHDRHCVRASLLQGEAEYRSGHYRQAIRALQRVRDQDLDFMPEVLPMLRRCYHELDDLAGWRQYLQESLQKTPSTAILLALIEEIRAERGTEAAATFLGEQLLGRPSLRGLSRLIELQENTAQATGTELTLLGKLVEQLLAEKPAYQCQRCGFAGRKLHWLCPSCKHWGHIKPIRGVEGD